MIGFFKIDPRALKIGEGDAVRAAGACLLPLLEVVVDPGDRVDFRGVGVDLDQLGLPLVAPLVAWTWCCSCWRL